MRSTKIAEIIMGVVFGVLTIAFFSCLISIYTCVGEACANDATTEAEVVQAIRTLQPSHSAPVAAAWGGVIWEASVETGIDPLLITSIVFRESSIREGVVGSRGELGPMQLHGAALRYRPQRCDPSEISCSIRGGSAVLQYWQAECQSTSWNIWVGAYGLGRCPSPDEAASLRSVRRAREIYERIGGTSWEE